MKKIIRFSLIAAACLELGFWGLFAQKWGLCTQKFEISTHFCAVSGDLKPDITDTLDGYIDDITGGDPQAFMDSFDGKPGGIDQRFALTFNTYSPGAVDFSAYLSRLNGYACGDENGLPRSASSRQLLALAMHKLGSDCGFISDTQKKEVGNGGTMSYVWGLMLSDAMGINDEACLEALLDLQMDDGGWAVLGESGDSDSTAMTVRALAGHLKAFSGKTYAELMQESAAGEVISDEMAGRIISAIDRAIALLSELQQENGGYNSLGKYNSETTSQVIMALTEAGINPLTDERFNAYGKSPLDSMLEFRLKDGTFSYNPGGAYNPSATCSACEALTALRVFLSGTRDYTVSPAKAAVEISAKLILSLAVCGAVIIYCGILLIKKKKKFKYYIPALIVGALAVLAVNFIDISTPEDYYGKSQTISGETVCATISINCSAVRNDGSILAPAAITLAKGSTAQDQIKAACRENGILLECESGYVSGIDNLYEFDFGELSGWMLRINGEISSVGSASYIINDGDVCEWFYTTTLGRDQK